MVIEVLVFVKVFIGIDMFFLGVIVGIVEISGEEGVIGWVFGDVIDDFVW